MSDPVRTLLGRVKELDERATEGPWKAHVERYQGGESDYYGAHIPNVADKVTTEYEGDYPPFWEDADAELTAQYRTLAPALARALEAVLEVCETIPIPSKRNDVTGEIGSAIESTTEAVKRTITEHLGGEG